MGDIKNIADIIKLNDGNDYILISKTEYENKTYLCLVNMNDKNDVKFCYLNNDEIILVNKEDLSSTLILQLLKNMTDTINKTIEDNK